MIVEATQPQVRSILGAMCRVAAPPSPADRAAIQAAYRYVFRGTDPLDVDALTPTSPEELARALPDPGVAQSAVRFLAVMALVDGRLDEGKIALVERYASRARHPRALPAPARRGRGGAPRVGGHGHDAPERPEHSPGSPGIPPTSRRSSCPMPAPTPIPRSARRYQALADLADGTFGRAFWAHYHKNGYAFPGEEQGLNEKFATPQTRRDSTHVLTGYDTTPRGEVLVSTFTAAMHRQEPMSGHILPVIFSWHLGIQLNAVAKSATGALDPEAFWLAWARGAAVNTDTFAPAWDFWAVVPSPWPTSDGVTPSRRSIPPPTRHWHCSDRKDRRSVRHTARRHRDRDDDAAAPLAPTVRRGGADGERAVVDLGHPPSERQTETDAPRRLASGARRARAPKRGANRDVTAIERLRHALPLLGRDTRRPHR